MTLMQYRVKCGNPACAESRSPEFNLVQDDIKPPRCGRCLQPLAIVRSNPAPVQQSQTPLQQAMAKARQTRVANTPQGNHVDAVLTYLLSAEGRKFQADFETEMAKDIDIRKFCGAIGRSGKAGDVCVDNALAAAGVQLPPGCPAGEKYSFEVPYMMQAIGWPYLGTCAKRGLLETRLSSVRGYLRSNPQPTKRQYLLVWTQNKGSSESHMVQLVVAAQNKGAWLHDPQKQPNNYTEGYCEAWSNPLAYAGKVKGPYCSFNLDTGERGAYDDKDLD